jgi:MFS family permease
MRIPGATAFTKREPGITAGQTSCPGTYHWIFYGTTVVRQRWPFTATSLIRLVLAGAHQLKLFQMLSIIVGWQIYSQTHSAFWLGMIGLVQFFPSVILALPAGHIADQFDRRRVVMFGQILEWAAIALLAWLTWKGCQRWGDLVADFYYLFGENP